jgi:DUF1680 family protein
LPSPTRINGAQKNGWDVETEARSQLEIDSEAGFAIRTSSNLPEKQLREFDLITNLKTAKQIGLKIPQWTLMTSTKVIQ